MKRARRRRRSRGCPVCHDTEGSNSGCLIYLHKGETRNNGEHPRRVSICLTLDSLLTRPSLVHFDDPVVASRYRAHTTSAEIAENLRLDSRSYCIDRTLSVAKGRAPTGVVFSVLRDSGSVWTLLSILMYLSLRILLCISLRV